MSIKGTGQQQPKGGLDQKLPVEKKEPGVIGWLWGGVKKMVGMGDNPPRVVDEVSVGKDVSANKSLLSRGSEVGEVEAHIEVPEVAVLEKPEHEYGQDFLDGYNHHILEKHGESYGKLLDGFEKQGFMKDFDRKLYEKDPMKFFMDYQNDFPAQKSLEGEGGHIEGCIYEGKMEFVEVWRELKLARQDYFVELGNSYFELEGAVEGKDPKMLKQNYDDWQSMKQQEQNAIDQWNRDYQALEDRYLKGEISSDELDKLEKQMDADFEKEWGEESANVKKMDSLYEGWYKPYREYYKGLSMEYLKRDPKYLKAMEIIQEKKAAIYKDGMDSKELMGEINKLFNEDKEFREQVYYVFDQERNLRQMMGIYQAPEDAAEEKMMTAMRYDMKSFQSAWEEFSEEAYAGLERDMERASQAVGDVGQYLKDNPGKALLLPATVGAAILLSSPVAVPAAAVGTVFAYHVGKQVIPPVIAHLEKQGVFADVEAAKKDKQVRMPLLEQVYSKAISQEKRVDALVMMHNAGLLLKEDLEMPELGGIIEAFKEKIGTDAFNKLPTKEGIAKMRQQWLPILRKPFEGDAVKLMGLKQLYDAGVLFKSDFEMPQVIDLNLRTQFLQAIQMSEEEFEDNMQTAEQFKAKRNRVLFIARRDIEITQDDKVDKLVELHDKGILFKQDLEKIRKNAENGDQIADKFLSKSGIKLTDLPDIATHYAKTKITLMREHDETRKPLLGLLKSEDPNKVEGALVQLFKSNILFKEDLEGLDEEVVKKALGVSDLGGIPTRKDFYERTWSNNLLKVGEVAVGMLKKGAMDIYNDPVNIVYGPLKGLKNTVEVASKALDDMFGTFTDVKTTALSDRVAKMLPTDAEVKKTAAFAFNKTVGTVKWSVMGAAAGASVMGIFGAKIGAIAGGIYGMCVTNGKVSQIPKGGFLRAFKFSAVGALIGAVVPPLLGVATLGLGLAGVVASSAAIAVATMGIGLIVPCLLFGIFMGFQIAGWTGKDAPGDTNDGVMEAFNYMPPGDFMADESILETN